MSFIDGPLPRDIYKRPLKKRLRILPAGGLGVSPSFKKSPKLGGFGGRLKLFQQSYNDFAIIEDIYRLQIISSY
jgi:hypothetical protein